MDLQIDVKRITKRFDKKTVIKNADMKIFKGDSIAVLGHNGSGKSTFLRLVCGLSSLSGGEIIYRGKLRFNYIPEHFPQMNVTARSFMKHIGYIDGLDKKTCDQRCKYLFSKFYMDDLLDIPLKHLSKGTLQKVGVIQALLIPCDVLLLDEPLSGQDMDSQAVFIDLMHEWKENGTTIIMACHEKYLVSRISNRIFEIREGGFHETGFIEDMDEMSIATFVTEEGAKPLPEHDDLIQKIEINGNVVRLLFRSCDSNRIIMQMIADGYMVRSLEHE